MYVQYYTQAIQFILTDYGQLGLLRRLQSFSLKKVSTPSHPEPVENYVLIRKLALLSQLAVFKDIIPGYRIRPLTDKEKAEKVSQLVQRTRDFEQGLVNVYQAYLRILDIELKGWDYLVTNYRMLTRNINDRKGRTRGRGFTMHLPFACGRYPF